MQETQVRSLVKEDLTCYVATEHRATVLTATEPVLWCLGAATTEPACPQAHAPQQEKPLQKRSLCTTMKSSPWLLQLEKSPHGDKDPVQPKINK